MFAIDLLWVRYGEIGGGVAVVLNLLDGLVSLKERYNVYLIVTRDNRNLFLKYFDDDRFHEITVNINSLNRKETIIYQNIHLSSLLKKNGICICLEPDNYIPMIRRGNVKYVTIIHDLQSMHYPENFTILKKTWLKLNWKNAFKYSRKIIAISQFTKNDILSFFNVKCPIHVIYNPIEINTDEIADFDILAKKYGIEKKEYYYTVSSMDANKNLITLLRTMKVLKNKGMNKKLVISGVGSSKKVGHFNSIVKEMGLVDDIIVTGFVCNAERNALYQNCELFLFPSIYEGFGMPPLEASILGAKVLTTRLSSIPEITQNAVNYVNDAFNAEEWVEKIIHSEKMKKSKIDLLQYDKIVVAKQYIDIVESLYTK